MKTVASLLLNKEKTVSISPETLVFDALSLLSAGNYGALPVVQGSTLVGILSERDYARKIELQSRNSKSTKVSEIMTPNPISVTPAHTVEECMRLMTARSFRHLPVVENQSILGIISMKDVVKGVLDEKEELLTAAVDWGTRRHEESLRLVDQETKQLRKTIEALRAEKPGASLDESWKRIDRAVESILNLTHPQGGLENASVLLATDSSTEEVIARLALGGTGVNLETVSSLEEGKAILETKKFEIVCVNAGLISLAQIALQKNPNVRTVFMTSSEAEEYIEVLKQYPFVSNVVSQSELDRSFTVKSILSTVSKIVSGDFFGMEKYLNWGAEIREHAVKSSEDRASLIQAMEEFCVSLGLRRTLVGKCTNLAEELLMNAIYDAPTDANGKHLYNHLPRSTVVTLDSKQEAQFRFGCDGLYFGISVRDPFGSLERSTILDYVASCFKGEESQLHKEKGGGGHGLFIILRSSHLVVFNVQKGKSTEVIALLEVDPAPKVAIKRSSFHYFEV